MLMYQHAKDLSHAILGQFPYPEQEGEFGVTVVNVSGFTMSDVDQRHDDIAEGRERLVDAASLLKRRWRYGEDLQAVSLSLFSLSLSLSLSLINQPST